MVNILVLPKLFTGSVVYFAHYCGQKNLKMRNLKGEKYDFGSQLESTVHHDGEAWWRQPLTAVAAGPGNGLFMTQ